MTEAKNTPLFDLAGKCVYVAGHTGMVGAALLTKGFYQLDPRDLGHRVPFIGRFQWSGQEHLFVHRLRSQFGVDAGGAEKEKPLHTCRI
jgi:hypothetical protein